jgi:hypothetical protein
MVWSKVHSNFAKPFVSSAAKVIFAQSESFVAASGLE